MTIDEAIKHCLEVAEENDLAAGTYEILAENNHNAYERLTAETNSSRCAECSADHRQLAEWLKELVELREQNFNLKLDNERLRDCVYEAARNGELDFAELSEAKRLLKLAIEDINAAEACDTCEYYPVINGTECQKDDCYKWRYTDEAEKLLGGNKNV